MSTKEEKLCYVCNKPVNNLVTYAIVTLVGGEIMYLHHTIDKPCYWEISPTFIKT